MIDRLAMLSWLTYRRMRSFAFSCAGRNPLAGGSHALTIGQEWASIKGLVNAKKLPAKVIDRDELGYVLWETALGRMWTPQGAGAHFVQQVAVEMQSNVYDLTRRTPGSEFIVMDCGANVGFFSRFALNSGATQVVSFEPSPDTAVCLRRNLATAIEAGAVRVIPKGVWDRETTLAFHTGNLHNPGDHHVVEDGEGDVKIPVTSIDTVAEELDLPRIDYIKMDIEGSETRAIAGARRTILRDHPQICVATEHTDDLFANTSAVIEAVRSIDPAYRYISMEAHAYRSPSRGMMLTPYSLLFQ